ncbi:MAG TPA: hypothetical protein VLI93_10425 [Acetobacteraceae bacterium]|nr:hypothetical protein [Acetobacteraceae bacterium]
MWRLALLGLCLSLSGCGFYAWHDLPFVAGSDPYMPAGASENLRRAQGIPVNVEPLQQEPGNVWPGPVEAEPTLETLEKSGGQLPNAVPPPELPPQRGSPVPPAGAPPPPLKIPPVPPAATPANPPVAGTPLYQTPQGPGVPTGGTSAYQTITLPNGTTAIVVPNGNGTSTIIKSDGTVQTVPTPK